MPVVHTTGNRETFSIKIKRLHMKPHFITTIIGCIILIISCNEAIAQQNAVAYNNDSKLMPAAKDWQIYDSLGDAYIFQGDTATAIYNYQKAVELNPSNVEHRRAAEKLKRVYMEQSQSFYLKEY